MSSLPLDDSQCSGEPGINVLLRSARQGDDETLAKLLDRFRNYLLLIANDKLPAEVRQKEAASDLVQQTMLEARADFQRFEGESVESVERWLKRILLNNVLDAQRRFQRTAKRRVDREVSLDHGGLSQEPAVRDPSPSSLAIQKEEACRLECALKRLSPEYQLVLRLRNRESLSFDEIGSRLNRSDEAARKLWSRAISALKRELTNGRPSS